MALSPGTRLGVFEIAQLIGAGGMGEVYRARDTKLDRGGLQIYNGEGRRSRLTARAPSA